MGHFCRDPFMAGESASIRSWVDEQSQFAVISGNIYKITRNYIGAELIDQISENLFQI